MIPNLRKEDFTTKQEDNTSDANNSKASTLPCISTPWSRLRDPRIVRVSRALGGKDRHSKVCTVRGLRDRRIRLSVPTAIQLYDLQDRLGLNQPSKVVDWLLNVAKHEIDELPPLQIPPGSFGLDHYQQMMTSHDHVGGTSSQTGNFDRHKLQSNVASWDDSFGIPKPNIWNLDSTMTDKSKEITTETADDNSDMKDGENISSINFFPGVSHTNLLNHPNMYNPYYRLDPSNFPLPQMGREDLQNYNVVPLPPTTLPQVLVCPPYFPSHVGTSSEYDNPKHINHFQMLSSSSTSQNPLPNSLSVPTFYTLGQEMRPLHLSMGTKHYGLEESGGSQSNNNEEFS